MSEQSSTVLCHETMEQLRLLDLSQPGLLNELLRMFEAGRQLYLNQLEQALANADFEELRVCAHTLKGSAAGMGALQLSKLAFEIEKKSRAQGLVTSDQLSALADEYDRALSQVTKFVQNNAVGTIS